MDKNKICDCDSLRHRTCGTWIAEACIHLLARFSIAAIAGRTSTALGTLNGVVTINVSGK